MGGDGRARVVQGGEGGCGCVRDMSVREPRYDTVWRFARRRSLEERREREGESTRTCSAARCALQMVGSCALVCARTKKGAIVVGRDRFMAKLIQIRSTSGVNEFSIEFILKYFLK